jgi:hypothetical protein
MKSLLQQLSEMPLKALNLRAEADSFADKFKKYFDLNKNKFHHVGDIDHFAVMSNGLFLVLVHDGANIAIMKIDKLPDRSAVIDDVWVHKDFSGKKLFSKLLWFLVSRQQLSPLIFGNVHSEETYNLIKSGAFSKFKKTWIHSLDDKEEPFSSSTVDDYYGSPKWKLKLEPTEFVNEMIAELKDSVFSFSSNDKSGYIRSSYDWQLDLLE